MDKGNVVHLHNGEDSLTLPLTKHSASGNYIYFGLLSLSVALELRKIIFSFIQGWPILPMMKKPKGYLCNWAQFDSNWALRALQTKRQAFIVLRPLLHVVNYILGQGFWRLWNRIHQWSLKGDWYRKPWLWQNPEFSVLYVKRNTTSLSLLT